MNDPTYIVIPILFATEYFFLKRILGLGKEVGDASRVDTTHVTDNSYVFLFLF